MKSMFKFRNLASIALLGLTVAMGSCVRKSFDTPPDNSDYDPKLNVTTTIQQMRGMIGAYVSTTSFPDTTFTQDLVIEGVVIADDRSGNFYKQIVIQDATAGIAINIDNYSLYTHYPVGRKLYIRLKGMTLSYNSGTPVLGLGLTEQRAVKGLVSADIDAHIIRGNIGNAVKDTVITLAQARTGNPYFINRLVTISDSLQFADTVRPYTDPETSTNRYLTQCGSSNYVGNTTPAGMIAIRSSNYANFHALSLPRGKGIITAIYTTFGTTAQLILRDTADVKFYGPRCGSGGGPVNPGTGALITIDSMRKLYPGTGTVTLGSYKISGIIISDIDNKNFSSGNFVIEDNSRKGAIIYISGSSAYKVGDSVVADLTGATLKLFSGALEIDNMTAAKVNKISSNKSIDPLTVTVAQLLANFAQYESTLIKVVNGTVSGGSTYGASNITLSDDGGTSKIQLYTTSTAIFASQSVSTTPKTYVAIPTPFNTTKELKLRNPATDVY